MFPRRVSWFQAILRNRGSTRYCVSTVLSIFSQWSAKRKSRIGRLVSPVREEARDGAALRGGSDSWVGQGLGHGEQAEEEQQAHRHVAHHLRRNVVADQLPDAGDGRSEEHTSELQSL